jgi:hypothetical protein
MKTQDKIAEAVDQVPALDKRGTFTGPTWEDIIPALEAVLAAGKDGVVAVVGMLKDVDDGADYKARYFLHVLSQYLGRPGKEAPRALFVEALASQLGGERSKGVQGYLARQLQVIGGKDCAPALARLLPDPELCEYATQALLAIRAGAVEAFRKALPELQGGPRLTVLQALGVLADAGSAPAMRAALADADREMRLAGCWGLARVGDAASVDAVLKAADVEAGYERIKAASSALLLAETLLGAGKSADAAKIYRHLKATRSDPSEQYVSEAAAEGLQKAGG